MSRRRKLAVRENHERWLVSYADFITLLFAFFVVLFASSQTDRTKSQQMSSAVKEAFEHGHFSSAVTSILGGATDDIGQGSAARKGPGGVTPPKLAGKTVELLPSLKQLTEDLKLDIDAGRIEVHLEARGLVISLKQAAFFPSGTDSVATETYVSLEKVAAVIRKLPNRLRLEGHTDSQPIHNVRFQSNWELSASRSIAMLQVLGDRFNVDRSRMAIGGYADTAPVASNNYEEGRAQNRRVDIVILNETGLLSEPK